MKASAVKVMFTFVPLLCLWVGVKPAAASFDSTIGVTITPDSGSFLYTYTVDVLPTSTVPLAEFDLQLTTGSFSGINTPMGAPLSLINAPAGFINLYTSGDPTISFLSTSAATDIQPGSIGTFSFVSSAGAVLQPYQLAGYDSSQNYTTSAGSIFAPVPEPSSLVLTGLGVLGLVGLAGRVRCRVVAPSS